MEQIKNIEVEIDELKTKKRELESERENWRKSLVIEGRVKDLEEKIQTRKEFIKAIIKNVENNHQYVNKNTNKQEQSFSAQVVQTRAFLNDTSARKVNLARGEY